MPSVLGEHIALDTTWRDAIDGDTTSAKVGGKSLDHSDDGHLASIVQGMVLDAQQARGDAGHENDAAAFLQVPERRLADEKLRARVQVENVVVLLFCHLLGLVPTLGAAVGHDDVEMAEVGLGFLEQPVDLADLGHVRLDARSAGSVPERFDDSTHFVRGGLAVCVVDHDGSAPLSEFDGTAAADATTGAGDEGNFAVETGGRDDHRLIGVRFIGDRHVDGGDLCLKNDSG